MTHENIAMKLLTCFYASVVTFAVSAIAFGFSIGMTIAAALDGGNYNQLLPGCGLGLVIAVMSCGNVLRFGPK